MAGCRSCGHSGDPEDVLDGFSVCPECGAIAGLTAEASPPPFDRVGFRYRNRLYGAPALLIQKLVGSVVRDSADRPIARVRASSFSMRRVIALAAGSVVFVAILLAFVYAIELPDGWLLSRLVMVPAIITLLLASLSVVALLSPGPDALLISVGRDTRALVRIRTTKNTLTTSEVDIEDGEGAKVGTLVLHRFRNLLWPLGHYRPIATLEDARSGTPTIRVRRASPFFRGLLFEREDDRELVATFACNPGMLARDALEIGDPTPIDTRLFVAAMIVTRP